MRTKLPSPLPIFIYNSIEDEWAFLSHVKDHAERKKSIIGSNRFSDCYLFVNAPLSEFIYISPQSIHTDFLRYYTSLTGSKVVCKVPQEKTHFICRDLFLDTQLLHWIVRQAKKHNQTIELYSYANTPYLYELKEKLESYGMIVILPDAPLKKDLWTISYFGSKTGFREAFHSLMPPGSICKTPLQAAEKAAILYQKNGGVVIKTARGNAGEGVLIYRNGELPPHKHECKKAILNRFKENSYWHTTPIVVETYIDSASEKKQPFPSIEGYIKQNGTVTLPYYCNMVVTRSGEFCGMEMAKNTLTPEVRKQVEKISYTIGKTYAQKGLRGRFDIDFIYNGKKLYANESNIRNNGGTDTYFIVKKLVGEDFFSTRYVFAHYIDLTIKGKKTFKRVMHILTPLLYQKRKKRGVIINSEAVIRHKGLSYIIVAPSKGEAFRINMQIKKHMERYS